MASLDRQLLFWLALLALGLSGLAVSFLGEFVFRWWNDLGEWLAWVSIALTIVAAVGAASRFQVRALGQGLGRVEGGLGRVEGSLGRVEQGIGRLEASSGRIEANTAQTVHLLTQIRDHLVR